MKKTLLTALALGFASTMLIAGSAMATVHDYSYDDTVHNLPGYDTDIAGDTNGTPTIDKMTVSYDDAEINLTVTVYMTGRRVFDTLLINDGTSSGDWNSWDYYAVDQLLTNDDAYSGTAEDGFYSVEKIDPITGEITYATETLATTGRVGQLNGMVGGGEIGTSFDPVWNITDNGGTTSNTSDDKGYLTYNFSGITLDLDNFVLVYAPYCANDIMIGGPGSPVPEPATMLLFGTGLAGLVGASRRRKKQA